MKYYLENTFPDDPNEPWGYCADPEYPCSDLEKACRRARKLSVNGAYGMTRVVDKKGKVYGTYAAGRIV